jgi:hypothetical protein
VVGVRLVGVVGQITSTLGERHASTPKLIKFLNSLLDPSVIVLYLLIFMVPLSLPSR